MLARMQVLWGRIRDSLWFLPAVITLLAAALAVLMVQLDRQGVVTTSDPDHWLLGGGAEGARGVLSAIAGGLITVTGVVFSVTIVALQLASSQFTPRVLRNFTADRSNQLVLGVFIGTFTYMVLVLRVIRSADPSQTVFVPRLAIAVAVLLALVSIGFLIYFIDHAARSMQVSVILDRVTRQALKQVERLFPERVGHADPGVPPEQELPRTSPVPVPARVAGYLQAVDGDTLFQVGQDRRLLIRMERQIGEFVLAGQTLATVWPAGSVDEEVETSIRRAFVVGSERTPDQDLEFGIIEISDIAVKALSPSVNDPTTALHCIDRLAEVLCALGTRTPPTDMRTKEGKIHFLARHLTYERAVDLAFNQILHYGADNPLIAKKLVDVLGSLAELVAESRRPILHAQLEQVIRAANDNLENKDAVAEIAKVAVQPRPAGHRSAAAGEP